MNITPHTSLSLDNTSDDTPDSLSGDQLKKIMKQQGFSEKYSHEHKQAYDAMLEGEKNNTLIEYK